jgi:hypothetical protein
VGGRWRSAHLLSRGTSREWLRFCLHPKSGRKAFRLITQWQRLNMVHHSRNLVSVSIVCFSFVHKSPNLTSRPSLNFTNMYSIILQGDMVGLTRSTRLTCRQEERGRIGRILFGSTRRDTNITFLLFDQASALFSLNSFSAIPLIYGHQMVRRGG